MSIICSCLEDSPAPASLTVSNEKQEVPSREGKGSRFEQAKAMYGVTPRARHTSDTTLLKMSAEEPDVESDDTLPLEDGFAPVASTPKATAVAVESGTNDGKKALTGQAAGGKHSEGKRERERDAGDGVASASQRSTQRTHRSTSAPRAAPVGDESDEDPEEKEENGRSEFRFHKWLDSVSLSEEDRSAFSDALDSFGEIPSRRDLKIMKLDTLGKMGLKPLMAQRILYVIRRSFRSGTPYRVSMSGLVLECISYVARDVFLGTYIYGIEDSRGDGRTGRAAS